MLEGTLQLSSLLHCSSPGWLSSGSGSFNILAFAGLFAVATTVGGVLLTDAVDVGEVGVKEGMSNANAQLQQLTSSPSGGDSKLLLEVVLGLFGVTATGVGKHICSVLLWMQQTHVWNDVWLMQVACACQFQLEICLARKHGIDHCMAFPEWVTALLSCLSVAALLHQKVLWIAIVIVFCCVQSFAQPWRVLLARWREAVLMWQSWQYSGQESSLQHASFLSPTDMVVELMCMRAMQLAQLRRSATLCQLSADMLYP